MSSTPEPEEGGFAGPVPKLTQAAQPDECIKILLATDNHIGYAEKDPVRGRDSINTFKEILDLAVANDVDMVLLAGDLFHENRPSRTSLYQTISALRERCLGDRPIGLELVSDAGIGIARDATWPGVNYEDYNINVSLPIFSIHGNHDDPQGVGSEGALCALDILSASGLVNYFGRMELPGQATDDAEALEDGLKVKPVLLQKGETKLALYGMGNIRDDRFNFELVNRRINLYRPAEDPEDWFNIILVHQNRVPHGPNNSVPDEAFGEEAHLVVWGHEHDCISQARPVPVTGRPYYISQPGSSIATSLAKGEASPKHVGLIKIQGKEFEFEPIRLRSVRPFVFKEISLAEYHDKQTEEKKKLNTKVAVNKYLKVKVNELIVKANAEWDELNPDKDEDERLLPLIRLRVDYSGGPNGDGYFEVGNPQRFGQDFIDKVANPRDIVQFHRKSTQRKEKVTITEPTLQDLKDALEEGAAPEQVAKVTVSSLVHEYLEAQNLNVLSESLIQNAVEEFVGKGDKDAMGNWVKKLLKETRNEILKKGYEPSKEGPEHDDLNSEMAAAKKASEAKYGSKGKGKGREPNSDEDSQDDDEDEEMGSESSAATKKGKGKKVVKGKGKAREPDSMDDDSDADSMASSSTGRGKKKPVKKVAAPKKAAAGRGKKADLFNSDEEEESEEEVAPKKKAPAKKLPTKKATSTSTSTRKTPARSSAASKKKEPETISITDSEDTSADEYAASAAARKRKR